MQDAYGRPPRGISKLLADFSQYSSKESVSAWVGRLSVQPFDTLIRLKGMNLLYLLFR
jgi:hypothetical protein